MELKLLLVTARNAVIEINDGGIYYSKQPYHVMVNGCSKFTTDRVITSIPDLIPNTEYSISICTDSDERYELAIHTKCEFVTLDVKDFGAKGDGEQNDTLFIQAAIAACPKDGRVLIPKGIYKITSLFLKSNLIMELAEGAILRAETDRRYYPIFSGMVESQDEQSEYNLGTWEGNPLPMYSAIITGIDVENVLIYGRGTIDGRAQSSDWWVNAKVMRGAYRPRLLFLNHCRQITVQGISIKNSPSWTIHPYFSNNLTFLDLEICNPPDSPNTDGLNPESCRKVTIEGVRFSLGDDCIALKSGKIYMGRKYKIPCEDILIRQCLMENGHGAITIGSEMAAGVKRVTVRDCMFRATDRGLRIKTRRGRGKDAVIDDISFEHIRMDNVMTPFVVNCFYCCDPDGKTEYVQSKECYPVDERTPDIRKLSFRNITCDSCHVAAAFFYGLPERKIKELIMRNIKFTYSKEPKCDVPAMMCNIEPRTKMGIFAANIEHLVMEDIDLEGQEGDKFLLQGIHKLEADC